MRRLWLAFVLGLPVALASAQSTGGAFVLRKAVIAGGASRSLGTGLAIDATAGQPAAGVQAGGAYRLIGGFHTPRSSVAPPDTLFRNGFE